MGRAQIENNGAFCTKGVGGRGVQWAARGRSAAGGSGLSARLGTARLGWLTLMKTGHLLDVTVQAIYRRV